MTDFTQVGSPLLAGDGGAYHAYGRAVALSRDGAVMAVGAYNAGHGQVYVYDLVNGAWSWRGTLAAPNGSDYEFGIGVALSGDGAILAVGATTTSSGKGGVYVYDWSGSAWNRRAVMVVPASSDISEFGWSVSLSQDGAILAAGCKWDYSDGYGSSVWLFDWSGSAWSERGSLYNGDGNGFGVGVALSGNGTILAVGEDAYNAKGGVRIYDGSGSAWHQRGGVLTPADAATNDYFGSSVALNNAGDVLEVGAIYWEGTTTNQGGVYRFAYSGSSWSQEGAVLVASDRAGNDRFGSGVALSGNALRLIVGAEAAEGSYTDQGQVYFFQGTPPIEIAVGGLLGAITSATELRHVPPLSLAVAATLGDIQGNLTLRHENLAVQIDATLAGVTGAIRVLRVMPRAEHTAAWRMWLKADHAASWTIPLAIKSHQLRWENFSATRQVVRSGWGGCLPVSASLRALYGDRPRVTDGLTLPWGNTAGARGAVSSGYGDRQRVADTLSLPWGDTAGVHRALLCGYGDRPVAIRALVHAWSATLPVQADHVTAWGEAGLPGTLHALTWGDRPTGTADLSAGWGDGVTWRVTHTATWEDRALAQGGLSASWGDAELISVAWSATWGQTRVHRPAHWAAWSSQLPVRADRALPWGDALGVHVSWAGRWADMVQVGPVLHVAVWQDRPLVSGRMVSGWGDGVALGPDHRLTWGDRSSVACHWETIWGDLLPVDGLHVLTWGESELRVRLGHHLAWSDQSRAQGHHEVTWAACPPVAKDLILPWGDQAGFRGHRAFPWGDMTPVAQSQVLAWGERDQRLSLTHRLTWGDQSQAQGHHEITWGYAQPVAALLAASWDNRAGSRRSLTTGWADCGAVVPVTHGAVWADQAAGRAYRQASWADASVSRQDHASSWTEATPSRLTHAAVYADREAAQAGLAAPWGQMTGTSTARAAAWSLTAPSRRASTLVWSLRDRPGAESRLRASWAVLEDVNLMAIDNVPEVIWQGRSVPILAARLSADEESPVWMAEEIVLADRDLWGAIALGDTLQFSIHEETWVLRVVGKGMSRPRPGEMLLSISAVSPLAWLDAPYASAITLDNAGEAVSAQVTVAALVAPVGTLRWDLDDWLIPPGALAMSETTPLQAAREIVAAIGGLLESDPDGTPVARRRHPVSVPAYARTPPDQVILDGDLFAFKVNAAPFAGFNRVVITNEDLSGEDARDRLAYFDEDANPYDGELRAWPNPWRPVTLGHTGHPETVMTALGERAHTHTELVEFIGGQGQVAYPVHTLVTVAWQHVDLGPVTAQGAALTATVSEQSLAWITYTTRSLDWQVSLQRDEAVQFVLI